MSAHIDWKHFEAVDIRVGTVISASHHPTATKPAYILEVDFGSEIGVLKSSAQITELYERERLVGEQVIAVVNFPPKQIGPIMSQCLVLGIYDADGKVVLLRPDKSIENGSKIG